MGEKTGDRRLEKEQRRSAAIESARPDSTYQIRVYCQNCGAEGRENIPVGTPIAEHECPTCGCFTLRKALFASAAVRRNETSR